MHLDYFGLSWLGGSPGVTLTNPSSRDDGHEIVAWVKLPTGTRLAGIAEHLTYRTDEMTAGLVNSYQRNAILGAVQQRIGAHTLWGSFGYAQAGQCTMAGGGPARRTASMGASGRSATPTARRRPSTSTPRSTSLPTAAPELMRSSRPSFRSRRARPRAQPAWAFFTSSTSPRRLEGPSRHLRRPPRLPSQPRLRHNRRRRPVTQNLRRRRPQRNGYRLATLSAHAARPRARPRAPLRHAGCRPRSGTSPAPVGVERDGRVSVTAPSTRRRRRGEPAEAIASTRSASARALTGETEIAVHDEPHGHRGGVPTAGHQSAEHGFARGAFVQAGWLRIELGGEGLDSFRGDGDDTR